MEAGRLMRYLAVCCLVLSGALVASPLPAATHPGLRRGVPVWVSADYVHAWTRGAALPPLLATNPVGTDPGDVGVPHAASTDVVFGGNSVLDGGRSGWQIRGGTWLDGCRTWGVELDYLQLGSLDASSTVASGGAPILSRPFVDSLTGQPTSQLIAADPFLSGTATAYASSNGLEGWGIGLRRNLACCNCCPKERLDWILGYRHYEMDDAVAIEEQLTSPLFATGTVLGVRDDFFTRNRFDGGELGLLYERRGCRWALQAQAKVALGARHGRVRIDGRTTVTSPGSDTTEFEGGLYALSTNIGDHGFSDFAAIYQTEIELQYRVTARLSLDVGYFLVLWPDVYRAGQQIDTTINPNRLPPPVDPTGPDRPTVTWRDSTFWAQGIQLGLTYRY